MKDEALRLALEALEGFIPYLPLDDEPQCDRYDQAITAIKQALEQSEPPKREWQRLTDVDVSKILDEQNGFYTFEKCFNFAKAIEAKLKERNT